ncbi:MAG: replication initiator protein [Microviridae sp.]|nr:MAG: replication initiator protein [Microviridae sp.]
MPYGGVQFQPVGSVGRVLLPCGQCIECRLSKAREWALRCVHESKLYRHSSFVTLTYDDDHLNSYSLDYRDFQLFAKRTRQEIGPFRFFMAGEYGEENWRPHFHALLFGVSFSDRQFLKKSPSGQTIYRSKILSDLWKNGLVSVGDVTFESAGYVARYVVKKRTGVDAQEHYMRVDPRTGEVVQLVPEFCRMSNGGGRGSEKHGGIGARFYWKFKEEMKVRDSVVLGGVEHSMPRYYDKLAERDDSAEFEVRKLARQGLRERGENAPPRLVARRTVAEARLAFKRRGKV